MQETGWQQEAGVGKKQLGPAPSIEWCSLPDLDHGNGLDKETQEKKKHGEHVGGEDSLRAAQRCYSHSSSCQ